MSSSQRRVARKRWRVFIPMLRCHSFHARQKKCRARLKGVVRKVFASFLTKVHQQSALASLQQRVHQRLKLFRGGTHHHGREEFHRSLRPRSPKRGKEATLEGTAVAIDDRDTKIVESRPESFLLREMYTGSIFDDCFSIEGKSQRTSRAIRKLHETGYGAGG